MDKTKVAAVGEHSSVILFHTAGIATKSVSNTEEAERAVYQFVKEGYEVIFLSERFAEQMEEPLKRYRASAYPLILPVPDRAGPTGYSMRRITENMEKAIGTNLFES